MSLMSKTLNDFIIKALLEMARAESGVFGNALDGG